MHIITGMLISLLFSENKKNKNHPLLDLRWPIITQHLLPGRVRFRIPLLVGQPKLMTGTKEQMGKIEGVLLIEADPRTGSVLVKFDDEKLQPELLYSALIRLLGLEKELERTPTPKIVNEISQLGKGINKAIYSQTNGLIDLKTTLPLVLGIVGIYRLITERPISMPASLTMVWWGFNALMSGENKGTSD
jgi:hypothetical protein